ncbi:MAG: DNA adenine methylase [Natronincolaceae bacterium]|jgi:DNA adenine methylase|nr:DNA adenine methylase [Bacillota bacterium]
MNNIKVSPFLKWAGGKRQLLPVINDNLPPELKSGKINKYIEPFVGGGAVLFDLLQKYKFKEVIINDYNENLINLYKAIKNDANLIINNLGLISDEYLQLGEEHRKEYYYFIREAFNNASDDSIEKSVYFLFLNKTCFNGLYRVNSKNQFNVPHGRYKNPTILDKDGLINISKILSNVKITHGDFANVEQYVDDSTFVYLDPPYRPLNNTSSFTSYSNNGFDDNEQIRLANFFDILNGKKAKLMLSNSDPKNTDADDIFFDDLYEKYNITRVEAKRAINSNPDGRGKLTELLITNY